MSATLTLPPGTTTLYALVGQTGDFPARTAAWPDGGKGGPDGGNTGGGGGGRTALRLSSGGEDILTAGGGGGGGFMSGGEGGDGGGLSGTNGKGGGNEKLQRRIKGRVEYIGIDKRETRPRKGRVLQQDKE